MTLYNQVGRYQNCDTKHDTTNAADLTIQKIKKRRVQSHAALKAYKGATMTIRIT